LNPTSGNVLKFLSDFDVCARFLLGGTSDKVLAVLNSHPSGTRLRAVVSDSSMGRRAVVGISVIAVLALVVAIPLARRFHLSFLTPSELASKRLAPPAPPDDSCAQIQSALEGSSDKKPFRNTNPFSADEVAIYRGILERWNSNSRGLLNVSNRTFPIDRDLSDCGCLKGIEPQSIVSAAHSFRILTGDVLGGNNIRLVDANKQAVIVHSNDPNNSIREGKSVKTAVNRAFSTGLFSMSEVAFDKEQQRALVSYSFVCGSLCGSGGVWLFEKVDGAWKKSEHVCGGWIS
jgi:hypothetical protein